MHHVILRPLVLSRPWSMPYPRTGGLKPLAENHTLTTSIFLHCSSKCSMEQTISFPRLRPPSPHGPSTRRRRRRTSTAIFLTLQTPDATVDIPPTSRLTLPSVSSPGHDPMSLNSMKSTKQLHAHVLKISEEFYSASSMDTLIQAYSKLGDFRSAAMVFFMGLNSGILSWNYLINVFSGQENSHNLLEVIRVLHGSRVLFSIGVLSAVLRACAELMEWWSGLQIHAFVAKLGLENDSYVKCSMMDFYAANSRLESSEKLFEEMQRKDTILWNKGVTLYVENGEWLKALELLREMRFLGVRADEVTLAKALHACGKLEDLKLGKEVHGYVWRSGLSSNILISNSLIVMYSKNSSVELALRVFESIRSPSLVSWNSMISCCSINGLLDNAWELFNEMVSCRVKPDLVTWNCLLSGYSLHGSDDEVFELFQRMQEQGLKPNSSSVTSMLRTISESSLLEFGKEVHCYVIRHGLDCSVYVGTSLVDMYVKCRRLVDARNVFEAMRHQNVCTWNSLIAGYSHDGFHDESLELLKRMECEGVQPDLKTWNSLICGFAIKGQSKQALVLLRQLKSNGVKPNVVSWTALISGSCQNGNYEDSLLFFTEMQNERIEPNWATLASLAQACAGLAFLKKGQELHCFAMRKGFDGDVYVATALVDMYCKSGSLLDAHRLFMNTPNKNLASWNAMIMGFAAHGRGREAISLFGQMCESGIKPDAITFTAILSACRHSGLISEGWKYFDDMTNIYNVTPTIEHYTCMVDLLGRGGYLDEAWDFIQGMPLEPDASVWGALLGACRTHRNLKLAEIAAKHLFKLEPYNSANYLLMMSLYAYENRWEDVENMRDTMNAVGVRSRTGWSWIEIDQSVHVFNVEGKPHPDIGEIYFELYHLISEMKRLGYLPDTSCIVHNVGEEEKEKLLMGHTEKLAIVYGLINTNNTSIRVITNTRVCNDCHMVAKYMSKISGREISLRDGIRFHHFMDGKCSCNDYW